MANAAFMKPHDLSPELEAVVGKGPMPRTEVTKKLWEYIKAHGLQDQEKKRIIHPDAALGAVLGNASLDMFEMTKKVSDHIKK